MSSNIRIGQPAVPFNPPVYQCRRATKPFTLDGNIDKAFWADADFTEDFMDIEGPHMDKPRYRTRAKMLWDDDNFYFGALLEGDEIWGTLTERDCVIFHDNDFEIFIDPDSDTHQYYEFEMNALNTVWDLFLTKPYRDMGKPLNSWDIKGLQTAVHIDGDLNNPEGKNQRWMVEVVMPFTSLMECALDSHKEKPAVGEFFRVNFSRVQWHVDAINGTYVKRKNPETNWFYPEDNWVWAPTGVINIHYPELWGFVFFTEGQEAYEIPQDELDKYQLRQLYYRQHEHLDVNGCFTEDIHYLSQGIDMTIEPKVFACPHTFEISCPSKDGKRTLWINNEGRTFSQER